MEKRIMIPDTDLMLSPIGLGTLNAGIKWDGKEADAILDAYLDMGGNVVDTARVYQDWIPGETGRSERVLGEWIKRSGKRNQIVLMTKGGHPKYCGPQDDLHISRMKNADMRKDLELSLQALQTDRIDIYFYHRDDLSQSVEEEIETMESFVREGKIHYYACSNWTADRMREADAYSKAHGYRGFVANQALMNVGMKYMNPMPDDTLTYIRDDIERYHCENPKNLAVAYYCSAEGYFHRYQRDGHVANEIYDTEGNRRVAEKLMCLAREKRTGITQVILGFLLCQPFNCLALYGTSNSAHMEEAMKTLDLSFTIDEYEEVFR